MTAGRCGKNHLQNLRRPVITHTLHLTFSKAKLSRFPFQGRHRSVSPGRVQQHQRTQGELSRGLLPGAAGRPHLRLRRERLQEHVPDEAAYLRVSVCGRSALLVFRHIMLAGQRVKHDPLGC